MANLHRLTLPFTSGLVTFGPIGCLQSGICFQNLDRRGAAELLEYRNLRWTVDRRSFTRALYLEQMVCTSNICAEGLTRWVKGDPVGSEVVRLAATGVEFDQLAGSDNLYGTAVDPDGRLYVTTLDITSDASFILSTPQSGLAEGDNMK